MRSYGSFLILIFTLWAFAATAETYRRLVNFDWEPIEGAKSYEIELSQVLEEPKDSELEDEIKTIKPEPKVFNFKVKTAEWSGLLEPGKYLMRLRSRDHRAVPGEWSEKSDFNVALDPVVMKSPQAKEVITATEEETTEVTFEWSPVPGAAHYIFELSTAQGESLAALKIKDPFHKQSMKVATKYVWKAFASSEDGILSETSTSGELTVMGPALASPKIEKPESAFVREIKWERPDHATGYDIFIMRQDPKSKKFKKFKKIADSTDPSLYFESSWPGGNYKMAVQAKAELRPPSTLATLNFRVHNGDRSPASEYRVLVRKSIDRVTGWYGIASYLITEIQYSGKNPEKNSSANYQAMGGTGRLGAGWFNPRSEWGFLGIIDLSGFTFNGKTQTFASAEANAIYRKSLGERAELRLQSGPYLKELPETVGDPFSGRSQDLMISTAGLHLGAELWYSLSPKFGVQINAHLYNPLMKINTPNNQELVPTISTQVGLLGSYRLTNNFTGLIGYAIREDRVSYRALTGNDSFASDGDVNESTVVGNYLNFFAEWAF